MIKKQHTQLESSTIESCQWTLETKELLVNFKSGASYFYTDVDPEDYKKFINSTSAGQALNHFIKGKYQFTKIEKDEQE